MGIPAEALLPFIFGNSGGGGGGHSGSGSFIPSFGTLATVSTGTSWSGSDPYTSTVTVTGYTVTNKTMVSVLPSTDVVEQMAEDGITNICITNNNGTLTATAVGAAPTAAMTLHVLCTESDQSATATVSTGTSWSGSDPYTSTVTVTGYTVTGKTMVSILPSNDVIAQMIEDGTTNIFITNNNGTLTATAVGAAPTAAMTLQVLCTESEDLTDAINKLRTAINGKQDKPATAGTAGQVLALDDNLNPVWADQSGGGGGTSDYTELKNKPQINGHTLDGNQSAADLGLGTYSKPASGIPKTDLASDVQASLGKADTALQTAPVQSVAGKTGAVTLGAGDVGYDGTETYQNGTAGAALSELNRQLSDKQDAPSTAGTAGQVLALDDNLNPVWANQSGGGGGGGMNIVNLSGTQITQVGTDNTFYVCGELTELTFTAPSVGITMIRFTSGTTPTVLTVNGVTSWMFDNDPTAASLEANKTYDINVLNGVGVVGWA